MIVDSFGRYVTQTVHDHEAAFSPAPGVTSLTRTVTRSMITKDLQSAQTADPS
jgi:hypothetical protein